MNGKHGTAILCCCCRCSCYSCCCCSCWCCCSYFCCYCCCKFSVIPVAQVDFTDTRYQLPNAFGKTLSKVVLSYNATGVAQKHSHTAPSVRMCHLRNEILGNYDVVLFPGKPVSDDALVVPYRRMFSFVLFFARVGHALLVNLLVCSSIFPAAPTTRLGL